MSADTRRLARVLLEGTARRSGVVASSPMPYAEAQAGLPTVLDTFATDIAAGDLRVSLVEVDAQAGSQDGHG